MTGWPTLCVREWELSGASATQLEWLRNGYGFDFQAVVPPIGLGSPEGGNHKGATEHAEFLHAVFAEFIALGVVSEIPHRPKVCCKINVIPKGDYDANKPLKRHRLRVLIDQRPLNAALDPPRFRNETLHKARS